MRSLLLLGIFVCAVPLPSGETQSGLLFDTQALVPRPAAAWKSHASRQLFAWLPSLPYQIHPVLVRPFLTEGYTFLLDPDAPVMQRLTLLSSLLDIRPFPAGLFSILTTIITRSDIEDHSVMRAQSIEALPLFTEHKLFIEELLEKILITYTGFYNILESTIQVIHHMGVSTPGIVDRLDFYQHTNWPQMRRLAQRALAVLRPDRVLPASPVTDLPYSASSTILPELIRGRIISSRTLRFEHPRARSNYEKALWWVFQQVPFQSMPGKEVLIHLHRMILEGLPIFEWADGSRRNSRNWAGVIRGTLPDAQFELAIHKYERISKVPESLEKVFREYEDGAYVLADIYLMSARIYKKLMYVHPFYDGNGRTVRLFVDLMLLSRGLAMKEYPPAWLEVFGHTDEELADILREHTHLFEFVRTAA